MSGLVRVGDKAGLHPNISGMQSGLTGHGNVTINGIPTMTVGGQFSVHGQPEKSPHQSSIITGSGNVTINGIPAARVGDYLDCGSVIITGSSNVTGV